MDKVTEYLFGQGVLGVMLVAVSTLAFYLFLDNKALTRRLIAKSEKDSEKNSETARQMVISTTDITTAVKALSDQVRALQTLPRRRQTATLQVPPNE